MRGNEKIKASELKVKDISPCLLGDVSPVSQRFNYSIMQIMLTGCVFRGVNKDTGDGVGWGGSPSKDKHPCV